MNDVTFSGGAWVLELATESDWGFDASDCDIDVGEWNGGFTAFTTSKVTSVEWSSSGTSYIVKVTVQAGSETVHTSKYLALQITNNDSSAHMIYTAEGDKASCLRSPQTDPGYPVPEIAAGILFALGLGGLGGYIAIRRKRTKEARL